MSAPIQDPDELPFVAAPSTAPALRAHLRDYHGCPEATLDRCHGVKDWTLWHRSEHKYLTPSKKRKGGRIGSITHRHPAKPTTRRKQR